MVRRHPRCRPGSRGRHPGCRPGSRARHPGCRPGSRARHLGCRGGTRAADARHPRCRSPAPGAGSPRCRARHPGVPRPAAGFSPPRKFGHPRQVPRAAPEVPRPAAGAAPRVPGAGAAAGRDAMEIHISSVPRAYLGSNLLVGSSRLELIKAGLAQSALGWQSRARCARRALLPGAPSALRRRASRGCCRRRCSRAPPPRRSGMANWGGADWGPPAARHPRAPRAKRTRLIWPAASSG